MPPCEPSMREAIERHVKDDALRAKRYEASAGRADRMRNQA